MPGDGCVHSRLRSLGSCEVAPVAARVQIVLASAPDLPTIRSCGWQAAAAPVPTTVAAQPGVPYSDDRLPGVGSLVVFANDGVAAQHKAKHAWQVVRVTAATKRGALFGGVSVCGVGDGVELASGMDPSDLAEPGESTGWLGVHYAVAMGCGAGVVEALLEAHREVPLGYRHPR